MRSMLFTLAALAALSQAAPAQTLIDDLHDAGDYVALGNDWTTSPIIVTAWDPARAGTRILLQEGSTARGVVFVGPGSLDLGADSGSPKLRAEWTYQNPLPGHQPVKVVVETQQASGESDRDHAGRFGQSVVEMMSLYPPNARTAGEVNVLRLTDSDPSSVFEFTEEPQEPVMEIRWKHDPDGQGPQRPMIVTVSVEKRPSESTTNQAKRFNRAVDSAKAVFPPNVDPPVPDDDSATSSILRVHGPRAA